MNAFLTLIKDERFIVFAMGIFLLGITEGLKIPYKLLTKKIAEKIEPTKGQKKAEKLRKVLNLAIALLPLGLGVLFDYLYSTYVTQEAFNFLRGLGYGAGAMAGYVPIETIFCKTKDGENPYATNEGKTVIKVVNKITSEKQGKKSEIAELPEVKAFFDNLKNIK